MESKLIRNSTAEFLMFVSDSQEDGIQVAYYQETVWATQKGMATLFDCTTDNIGLHLKKIYNEGELDKEATTEYFSVVQKEGERQVSRKIQYYNLDTIISVGYRVNSRRATQFRQWATNVLRQFAIRGYVLDKQRLKNGTFLSQDYFDHLLSEIREIRLSERRFYQKLTDIYATSIDYNVDAPTTRIFFKKMQNKMHYATHGHTASELILERANAEKENMGLTSWENGPKGKIVKTDVSIAKNYLKKQEIELMGRIVAGVLDLAETQALKHIPMTMEDWNRRIDMILQASGHELLNSAGSVTAEEAKQHAETEFEKYRIIQDRLFASDFDIFIGSRLFDNLEGLEDLEKG
ncbi:MAG: virulence RhuM family protein [Bacteroidales bacterium]|nr:virulence RhuM family protein [Bacteroidales bacterium]MCD8393659.1 virulence RhuM family protein [Bacteroidales bacterium]